MQAGRIAIAIAIAATLTLAGCGGEPRLMNLTATGDGPDEFGIVPPKALEQPEDLTALPPPTLGGSNRTDQDPEADAVIALGGRPDVVTGVATRDGALVSSASRYGRNAGIRETLAAEDLDFRRDNNGKILERLFGVTTYYRAYRRQSLDQHSELERWRRAGVRTNSAPPPQVGE